VQRLRAVAPATFTFICQDPKTHLPAVDKFFGAALARSPIELGDDAHHKTVMLSDFGHVAVPAQAWRDHHINPSLSLDELHVRIDSVEADRGFISEWQNAEIDEAAFRRFAGLHP